MTARRSWPRGSMPTRRNQSRSRSSLRRCATWSAASQREMPRHVDIPHPPDADGSGDRVVDRRAFLGTVAGGLLAARLAAEAQEAGKVWRIGYLSSGFPPTPNPLVAPLRALGWVEGQNLVFESRYDQG